MSLIYFTGFEHGTLSDSTWQGDTHSISSAVKRTGNYSLRCNPGANDDGFAQYAGFSSTTGAVAAWNVATAYVRFYMRIDTLPASLHSLIFRTVDTGGFTKVALDISPSGHLMAYGADGVTQIGSTGTATLSTGVWYRIEVKSPTGNPATLEVKVEGVVDITGAGDTGVSNNGFITFGRLAWTGQSAIDVYYDDVAVNDSEYPGEGAVLRLDADGDGTYTAWTGAAPKWQQVDEVPANGGDYLLSTLTVGDAETVTLESCASAGVNDTIKGVIAQTFMTREWLSNLVKFRLRSGTTNVDTATGVTVGAAVVVSGILLTQDPDTSAAWTTGGVDGVEIGCIEASTVDQVRWCSGYLMVEFGPAAAPPGMGQVI